MAIHSRQDGGVTVISFEEIMLFLSEGHQIEDLPDDVQAFIRDLPYEDQMSLDMLGDVAPDDSESDEEGDEEGDEE